MARKNSVRYNDKMELKENEKEEEEEKHGQHGQKAGTKWTEMHNKWIWFAFEATFFLSLIRYTWVCVCLCFIGLVIGQKGWSSKRKEDNVTRCTELKMQQSDWLDRAIHAVNGRSKQTFSRIATATATTWICGKWHRMNERGKNYDLK